jgi:quinol monooxygenase YgiN
MILPDKPKWSLLMIIVSGKAKVRPGAVEKVRREMENAILETRKEAGCVDYSYGLDVLDPETIIVLEYWESQEALTAHFTQRHMAAWMTALNDAGVISQDIKAYEVAGERQLLG